MCLRVNLPTTCSSLLISIEPPFIADVIIVGGVRCEGGGALGGSPLSNDWRNDDEVGGITGANGGVELIGGVATRLFVGVTTGEPEEG